jgi:hypothetical protein
VLTVCAPPVGNQEGNVTISLPGDGGGRAIAGEVLDNLVYVMVFSGPGGGQMRVTTLPGEHSVTLTLDLGDWTVRVDASVNGTPFGSGEADFRVRSGGNNSVTITMKTLDLPVTESLSVLADIAARLGSPELAYRGRSDSDPIPLAVTLDLADASEGWAPLLDTIGESKKFVALNLSACTMGGSLEFDPDISVIYGKNWIVSLVLPDAAASIADGTGITGTDHIFNHLSALKRVEGEYVTTIGEYAFDRCTGLGSVNFPAAQTIGVAAFRDCTSLGSVSLPEAQTIGGWAFDGCTSLSSVSLPKAQTIGSSAFGGCTGLGSVSLPKAQTIGMTAFGNTGTGDLTVTLGGTPPELGPGMFFSVSGSKTVTVRVPASASGYAASLPATYTSAENTIDGPHWGEGFRGIGWDNSGAGAYPGTDPVNEFISLTVETYAP